jgi:peroxiredoxin
MRSALRTVGTVVVVVGLAFAYVQLAENKGYVAPAFRLPSLAGTDVDLASFRGRVVVLNFWATWCPPCVQEMPSLERLHRVLGPEGLVVLTVSADEDRAELARFVKQNALTLPVLSDPGGRVAVSRYHTTGYPETFTLDRSGVILDHVVGPVEWDAPETLARFRALLGTETASR